MAAEVQELVLGFDFAFLVKDLIEEILGHKIRLEVMIDRRTVFNVVAKDGQTSGKRKSQRHWWNQQENERKTHPNTLQQLRNNNWSGLSSS